MDQLLLNLSYGLGLQQTIGWFLPIFLGTVNVLSSLLAIFRYADKSAEYNRQNKDLKELEGHVLYDFIIGEFVQREILFPVYLGILSITSLNS